MEVSFFVFKLRFVAGWLNCWNIYEIVARAVENTDKNATAVYNIIISIILDATKWYVKMNDQINIACRVINEKTVASIENTLYTVRWSRNSFVGSDVKKQHGNIDPDKTMRLFNLL